MESAGVLSNSVSLLIRVSPYQQDTRQLRTGILSTKSVNNKTCLEVNSHRRREKYTKIYLIRSQNEPQ